MPAYRHIGAAPWSHPKLKEFLVINLTTGGRPTVAHAVEVKARAEAARLAAQHPGHMFTVVQVCGSFMSTPQVKSYD